MKQIFPDLDYDFNSLVKSWQPLFANHPSLPRWIRSRFTYLGKNEEDVSHHLKMFLHYAARVKHVNLCQGYYDRLRIKSRTPFANNVVLCQGKESSVLRAPDHNLWYGSEKESSVQLVVFETNKCEFECSQKLRLCPCCEAQVIGKYGDGLLREKASWKGEVWCL